MNHKLKYLPHIYMYVYIDASQTSRYPNPTERRMLTVPGSCSSSKSHKTIIKWQWHSSQINESYQYLILGCILCFQMMDNLLGVFLSFLCYLAYLPVYVLVKSTKGKQSLNINFGKRHSKHNNYPGPDQINNWIYKHLASTIAPILNITCQHSLNTSSLLSDWKEANISPVYKKGSRPKQKHCQLQTHQSDLYCLQGTGIY